MQSARASQLLARLRARSSAANRAGMARFGIHPARALGVSMKDIRAIARGVPRDHRLARELWATKIHEARILATILDEPAKVTAAQMDRWARAFDSWDLCDQACLNLFDRTPHATKKALEWSRREREFEKRAGFALMAVLAWHRKDEPDSTFRPFLDAIRREASDPRNYVKKAASWALRQIGKRGGTLRIDAVALARALAASDDAAARWVGRDAVRELAPRLRRPASSRPCPCRASEGCAAYTRT